MTVNEAYDNVLCALCIWREARGTSSEEWRAVLWTILNRVRDPRWPNSIAEVVTQPKQFSSFNAADPNVTKFPKPDDHVLKRIWHIVTNPGEEDPTKGANHYHSYMPLPPSWAKPEKITLKTEHFTFYKL